MQALPPIFRNARYERLAPLLDGRRMLEVFRSVLPGLTPEPVTVRACTARATALRSDLRAGRIRVHYILDIEIDARPRAVEMLGTAPVTGAFPDEALSAQCDLVADHPWVVPFRRLAVLVPELDLGLQFVPVDPALPALAELTGAGGGGLVGECLPEYRNGVTIEATRCELRKYRPGHRAVVRTRVDAVDERGRRCDRTCFVKVFRDDRAEHFEDLRALDAATGSCAHLAMPRIFGYDRTRRSLLMDEVAGERTLGAWLADLRAGRPLPEGTDHDRVAGGVTLVARLIAELQGCPVTPTPRVSTRARVDQLREDLDLVPAALPEVADELVRALRRVDRLAPAGETLVPCHGGLRPKQLIGDDRALTVLDWDGLVCASPAADAASFVRRLGLARRGGNGDATALDRLAAIFCEELLRQGAAITEQELALQECLVLVEAVLRWCRRPGGREPELRALLIDLRRTGDDAERPGRGPR